MTITFSKPQTNTDYKHILTTDTRRLIIIHMYRMYIIYSTANDDFYNYYSYIEDELNKTIEIVKSIENDTLELNLEYIESINSSIIQYLKYFSEYYIHINTLISSSLIKNTIKNISITTRTILRLAIFEIIHLNIDIPLVIHEYLIVAENFSISKLECGFINKLIQSIFNITRSQTQ